MADLDHVRKTDIRKATLTLHEARKIIRYNHEDGSFVYLVDRSSGKIKAGSKAGFIDVGGYHTIGINSRYYKAHRLAWLLYYGVWPSKCIDHINGIKTDNRICNLRLCERHQNSLNTGMFKNNSSGMKGVYYRSRRAGTKNWVASIQFRGKIEHKYFYTAEDAFAYRQKREIELYGEFSRLMAA